MNLILLAESFTLYSIVEDSVTVIDVKMYSPTIIEAVVVVHLIIFGFSTTIEQSVKEISLFKLIAVIVPLASSYVETSIAENAFVTQLEEVASSIAFNPVTLITVLLEVFFVRLMPVVFLVFSEQGSA